MSGKDMRYLLVLALVLVPISLLAGCDKPVYLVGVDIDDGTEGIGWLTGDMRKWWNKKGKRKYSQICFVQEPLKAKYTLIWKGSFYWARATVFEPNSKILLYTSYQYGRRRWSNPYRNAFRKAIRFIDSDDEM